MHAAAQRLIAVVKISQHKTITSQPQPQPHTVKRPNKKKKKKKTNLEWRTAYGKQCKTYIDHRRDDRKS